MARLEEFTNGLADGMKLVYGAEAEVVQPMLRIAPREAAEHLILHGLQHSLSTFASEAKIVVADSIEVAGPKER